MDLAGGPGTYSIALCERHSDLAATVFDRPDTLAITSQVVERHGMADRVGVEEGDWDQESYGSGYDVALLSNILHGPTSGAHDKLRKVAAALEPSGLLVVQDFLLNDEKTGPLPAALFNIMVGAYSEGELLRVVSESGFRGAELVASGDRGNGVITALRV